MSLDTLLEAAEFLESSSKGKSKDDSAIARVHHSATVQLERRRAFSECEPLERRRRPGGAGTRETHNKLEKNRRAHLKECFDVLKKEVPSLEDKKTSNLNILRSALKYIQTLKKRERDYEAERDLLTISNNSIEQRLGVLKKEMVVTQNVAKNESKEPNDEMPASPSEGADADKVRSVETHVAPVSVATQTTFTSGEESTAGLIEGESVQVEAVGVPPSKGLENGIKEEENVEEKVCVDDEDEEVDVEGEVTDDNIVDDDDDDGDEAVNTGNTGEEDGTQNGVDDSLVAGGENHNLARGEGKVEASLSGKTSASSKRKAACNDDGNKLDTKKSNIQCCARVSC